MAIDASIVRKAIENAPYLRAEDLAAEHSVPARELEAQKAAHV